MSKQKKIACMNDFSGYGRCSLTVSIPILSALKVQACPVPTSILSNHTAYPYYFIDDYTEKLPNYLEVWKKLELKFDGILTGYLGSVAQIDLIKTFFQDFRSEHTLIIVDPVMGDHGKPYPAFAGSLCKRMQELVKEADIITPNLTEACILTNTSYKEGSWKKGELLDLAVKLATKKTKKVVITGISNGEEIINLIYESGKEPYFFSTSRIGEERCGTGDVFASIVAADAVLGVSFRDSVKKASDFVKKCILKSIELEIPKTDGVCFEELLTTLS